MKYRILEFLCCPSCRNRLTLRIITEKAERCGVDIKSIRCRNYCSFHGVAVDNGHAYTNIDCNECYKIEIEEGILTCKNCGSTFPVKNGIPRMFPDFIYPHQTLEQEGYRAKRSYKDLKVHQKCRQTDNSFLDKRSDRSFGLQWKMLDYEERTWAKDLELRKTEFLHNMGGQKHFLKNKLLLDAGCGNGKLTNAMTGFELEVVGMDFSLSVERAHNKRHQFAEANAAFSHFVQGDVMKPPFQKESFDLIHSSGVLHHTHNTLEAFQRIASLVNRKGRFYVQLYRKRGIHIDLPFNILRKLTTRFPIELLYSCCLLLAPLHKYVSKQLAILRGNEPTLRPSTREQALIMFDTYSPKYRNVHTIEELFGWFKENEFENINEVTLENEKRYGISAFADRIPSKTSF
jgi:uncharacterized protein YbaR (Trm112 family)/ubiquinone/menaquinone biosynthesis C-methylase UbiE